MLKWGCLKVKAFKTTTYKKAEVFNFGFFMLIDNIFNLLTVQLLTNSEHRNIKNI